MIHLKLNRLIHSPSSRNILFYCYYCTLCLFYSIIIEYYKTDLRFDCKLKTKT